MLLCSCAPAFAWRFAVTGDSRGANATEGINAAILSEIASALAAESLDLVLFPGDLIYGGLCEQQSIATFDEWRQTFLEPLRAASVRVYPVRGNHEIPLSAWQEVFAGDNALPDNGPWIEKNQSYSFTHENALFVGVDCYAGLLRSYQVNLPWLYRQLSGNTLPHAFVFGHVPAFSVEHSISLGLHPIQREIFWSLLGHFGVRTYFCGHDHFFDDAVVSDWCGHEIHQLVAGTAGAPLANWRGSYLNGRVKGLRHVKQFGYVLAEVDGLNVTLTFKERTAPNVFSAAYSFDYPKE